MIKRKLNRKWKIPHILLERRNLCFSSYKNLELKVKLWWVGAGERGKSAFLVTFIFLYYFFALCTVYWVHFLCLSGNCMFTTLFRLLTITTYCLSFLFEYDFKFSFFWESYEALKVRKMLNVVSTFRSF